MNQPLLSIRPQKVTRQSTFGIFSFVASLVTVVSFLAYFAGLIIFRTQGRVLDNYLNWAGVLAMIWLALSVAGIFLGYIGLHDGRKKTFAVSGLILNWLFFIFTGVTFLAALTA